MYLKHKQSHSRREQTGSSHVPFRYYLPLHQETHWPCLGPGCIWTVPSPFLTLDLQASLWVGQTHPCQEVCVSWHFQGTDPPTLSCGFMRHQLGVKKPASTQGGNVEPSQPTPAGRGKKPIQLWARGHSKVTAAITEPSHQAGYGLCTCNLTLQCAQLLRSKDDHHFCLSSGKLELRELKLLEVTQLRRNKTRSQQGAGSWNRVLWTGPAGGGVVCFPLNKESF